MKAIISLLGSLALLSACSPSANFSNVKDAQFKSLMDGETVEVVSDSDLNLILESGDDGSSSASNSNNDTGTQNGLSIEIRDNERFVSNNMEQPKTSNEENGGKKSSDLDNGRSVVPADKEVKKELAHNGSCRDRLISQDKDKKFDDMVIAPKEIDNDKEVSKVLGCGKNGEKKVLVCHFPNADYSKRKTLCIGRPALEAHLKHLGEKRDSEHNDYAGACQSDEQNKIKKDKESNDEDEKEEPAKVEVEKEVINGEALI